MRRFGSGYNGSGFYDSGYGTYVVYFSGSLLRIFYSMNPPHEHPSCRNSLCAYEPRNCGGIGSIVNLNQISMIKLRRWNSYVRLFLISNRVGLRELLMKNSFLISCSVEKMENENAYNLNL